MRSRHRRLVRTAVVAFALLLLQGATPPPPPPPPPPVERVVAEIAGEPVFRTEWLAARILQPAAPSPQESLERYVDTRLLAREAARFRLAGNRARVEADVSGLRERGVSEATARRVARHAALADRLVDVRFRQVVVILDSEVAAHHRVNRDRFPGPLDSERPRVRADLAEAKVRQGVEGLLNRLYRSDLVILRPVEEVAPGRRPG